jgi:N-acetylglucosamine-6-sulfatase
MNTAPVRRVRTGLFIAVVMCALALPSLPTRGHSPSAANTTPAPPAPSVTGPTPVRVEDLPVDDDTIQRVAAPTDPFTLLASHLDAVDDAQAMSSPSPHAEPTARPNIVVFLIDDFGSMDERIWNYLPTLKNLFVDHGTLFSNYVGETALCCPGRADLLTGQHTFNHGVVMNDGRLLNPDMTLATQLHTSGYYSFISGKYLNQTEALADKTPPGWDHAYVYSGGYFGYTLYSDGVPVYHGSAPGDYSTDVIANKAIVSLKSAPVDRPLFAWIAPYAVHEDPTTTPYPVVGPKYAVDPRCTAIPHWDPPNYNELDTSDKPAYVRKFQPLADPSGWDLAPYCRALLSVDDLAKRVTSELIAQGRFDNTLFILTSDNGMNFGAHRAKDKKMPYAVQMPLFTRWPARLGAAPRTITEPIVNIDVAPTLCELAGCSMGPYANGQTRPDGQSFLPLLLGDTDSVDRDAILEDHLMANNYVPRWYGVQTTAKSPLGLWQYVEYVSGDRELYDLSNGPCYLWTPGTPGDPCELDNLLGPNATPTPKTIELAAALKARLGQLKAERGGTPLVDQATVELNGGAATTPNRMVVVTVASDQTSSAATSVRLSNDGATWSLWTPLGGEGPTRLTWTLPGGYGTHEVLAQLGDGTGNVSLPGSSAIVLDSGAAATAYTVSIERGARFTASTQVLLDLRGPAGTAQMQLSNDPGFVGATWEPYTRWRSWTIADAPDAIVSRTVYVRFRASQTDPIGQLAQASIVLDHVPPAAVSPMATGGAAASSPGPRNATIDTRAADQPGGSGVGSMQLSTDPGFLGAAWQPYATTVSWSYDTRAATTVYVRFRDRVGNVSTRSSVRLSAASSPSVPTQVAPPNTLAATSRRPTFRWQGATSAASYQLQISSSSTFVTKLVNATVAGLTFQPVASLPVGTLWWRVRKTGGSWSPTWTVKIPAADPPPVTAPAGGARLKTLAPTLTWSAVSGATGYQLQLASDASFNVGLATFTTQGTSLPLRALARDTTYFWHVRAQLGSRYGAWSPGRSFVTPVIDGVTPRSPLSGSHVAGTTTLLRWSGVAGAIGYRVQVCSDSSCSRPVVDAVVISAQLVESTLPVGTYWWRARALTPEPTAGPWSACWSFTR